MRSGWPATRGSAGGAISTAVIITLVGVAAACIVATLSVCCALVWTDLLHVNPNRTLSNVLTMLVLSPVYGLLMGLFLLGLPIAAGGLIAALVTFTWAPPSRTGMAGIAAASTVLFVRWCYIAAEAVAETPDWQIDASPWSTLIGGSALLTASLYAGWWVQRRMLAGIGPAHE